MTFKVMRRIYYCTVRTVPKQRRRSHVEIEREGELSFSASLLQREKKENRSEKVLFHALRWGKEKEKEIWFWGPIWARETQRCPIIDAQKYF